MSKLIIYTDGGSRGNPGPAAIGAVIRDQKGEKIKEISKAIGKATNNQAEYQALLAALDFAVKNKAKQVDCYLDSELVVKQLKGEYKVKDRDLAVLFLKVINCINKIGRVSFQHVRREKNKEADALVNRALDQRK